MNTLESAIAAVPAVTGVAAKHLNTGRELAHQADDLYFTASTFKVPILIELYRQVDMGIVDPADRLELTDADRAPGSGVLKELAAGLRPTVRDLATLMIIVSDNTATDMLYRLVGRDRLNHTMRDLGLHQTSLPMTCKELLYSMYGVETDDVFEGIRQVADALAHGRVVAGSDGLSEQRSDVSSPRDMVRLLEMLYRGDLLSEPSTAAVMDILERQQAVTIIPYGLPPGTRVAHKTGGVTGVRCDVGIVFAPSGPYAIALMAKQVTDPKEIDRALAAVSKAVYDELGTKP